MVLVSVLGNTLDEMAWGVTPDGNSCAALDEAGIPQVSSSLRDRIILCTSSLWWLVQIQWVSPEYWSRDGGKEESLLLLGVNEQVIPQRRLYSKNNANSFIAADGYTTVKETLGHLFSLPCSISFYPEQTPEYGWGMRWDRGSTKMEAIGSAFLSQGCNRNL